MDKVQFYERVNELLLERGWTGYQLAKEAGLSSTTLYGMIRKQSEPKLETFLKIVNGFHISVDEFVHPDLGHKSLSDADWSLIRKCDGFSPSEYDVVMSCAEAIAKNKKKK